MASHLQPKKPHTEAKKFAIIPITEKEVDPRELNSDWEST